MKRGTQCKHTSHVFLLLFDIRVVFACVILLLRILCTEVQTKFGDTDRRIFILGLIYKCVSR